MATEAGPAEGGALRAVAAEPHGTWVLVVVAVGLAASSVSRLARAHHPVG